MNILIKLVLKRENLRNKFSKKIAKIVSYFSEMDEFAQIYDFSVKSQKDQLITAKEMLENIKRTNTDSINSYKEFEDFEKNISGTINILKSDPSKYHKNFASTKCRKDLFERYGAMQEYSALLITDTEICCIESESIHLLKNLLKRAREKYDTIK